MICFANQQNPILPLARQSEVESFWGLKEEPSFRKLKTSNLPPSSRSLFFLHSASFSAGWLPYSHTYTKCSTEALPFHVWGMRFKTDQSKHSISLDPVTGSGMAQDLSQLGQSELHDFSRRQRKGYLLFPVGLAPGSFCNDSRCHHREPKNESDNKAKEERSRKSGL